MKVVINVCYGGFGLSQLACEKLIERGWPVVMSSVEGHPHGDRAIIDFSDDKPTLRMCGRYSVSIRYRYEDAFRTDEDLVAVVEELGSKAASGEYAKLGIVEVPDGVSWTIEDYDGMEYIAEAHRTWR